MSDESKLTPSWRVWPGGDAPPTYDHVWLMLRNGNVFDGHADKFDWRHYGLSGDIIRWDFYDVEPSSDEQKPAAEIVPDTAQKAADGWIEWNGGDPPVPDDTLLEVVFRNGDLVSVMVDSLSFQWGPDPCSYDIVRYRILKPAAQDNPTPKPSTAPDLLDAAAGHMRDRAATYDQPGGERSMGRTMAAFNAITGRDLTESEGFLLLQILKDVRDRQRSKPHRDSLEDGIAYAALKAEARLAETKTTTE